MDENASQSRENIMNEIKASIKRFISIVVGTILTICVFLSTFPAIPFYAILAGLIAVLKFLFIKLRKF